MKKIIFIDVDGTLVDYEGHLPESAVKAIRPMSFSLAYGIEGANTLKIIVSWFVDDKNLIVLAKTQKLGRGAS